VIQQLNPEERCGIMALLLPDAKEPPMCDDLTEADNERTSALSRREFGVMAGAGGVALLLPETANAMPVADREVTIKTPDGTADAWFVHPAKGKHPGVLIWPDIMGLRPAFRQMAKRLAEAGYAVLVVNPFYRKAKAPVITPGESFQDPAVRAKLMPLAQSLTPAGTVSDAKAFIAFLDAQPQVDTKRRIGTTGYCMGGPMTLRTAGALPARIGAVGSFHGGGLTTPAPDSPHLLIPKTKAGYLIAIAQNDDERDPESKTILKKTFAGTKLLNEVEVYQGAMHGWCPPDSRAYNPAQAERAWSRMLALFQKSL
jgi:carboxymethylenebutenolidase